MQKRKLMRVLEGETVSPPPIWLMRQAGRYLPEYRAVREKAGGFLNLCYTPDLATEVTLQPIRRYRFDAAILFSDILILPDALKRGVRFEKGEGPRMEPISASEIEALADKPVTETLKPVLEAIQRIREALPRETTLIGFCGAPWTVATYMIAGRGTPDQAPARLFAYRYRKEFLILLDILADLSAEYLIRQLEAGADTVQIFDSWAGILGEQDFYDFAAKPVARIIERVRTVRPDAKVIAFAKGAGLQLKTYRQITKADAIGLDWTVPLEFASELQKDGAVQGNLDPLSVVAGGTAMRDRAQAILDVLGNGPLIFNLGHGITPEADPEHVTDLVNTVRGG
ncbi:uroporphyrinogen decarboxylase [Martelella mediterranea]|uniref:Uroporphyrinogen decarboxylase n=1 Tax=Martelella mediterranea TaxID=293089 RepID=A0A4R3NW66_9HYPH|nr:uroporphyrinogen decarboxylase [Martelella mediterranea]TCT44679.1 uroporphyrinogen decarboxylase [Martelella mediterranea]